MQLAFSQALAVQHCKSTADYSTGWLSSLSLHARMHKAIRANPFLTYPKRSIDMGGEEGGVCMDPAMVKEELAQWGLWWSPFNLSGGVNMPPPPSEI